MRHMKYARICLSLALLSACSPNVETRGHLMEEDWKAQITPGVTTQDQVLEALGSPSAKSSFGDETWYYINMRRESTAFLRPEIADQSAIAIRFSPSGTVDAVEAFDKSQAKDIAIAKRVTPTEGHQMTFMEQMLGNLGRFNSPTDPNSRSGQRRPF